MSKISNLPFVSIVIPTKRTPDYLKKCLNSLVKQNYPKNKFEIVLVSTQKIKLKNVINGVKIKVIYDEKANPAEARNIGLRYVKGNIIGFIDDDCIAEDKWILKAVDYFKNKKIAVIGGPGLQPKNVPFSARASNYLVSSYLGSSSMCSRYSQRGGEPKEGTETDLILCNTFARKEVLDEVGGFNKHQVPCEENELYYKIKNKGYKLLYVPNLIVYHLQRGLFKSFFKRIFFYAIGRGVLLCRIPKIFKIKYILPSLFSIMVALIPLFLIYNLGFVYPFLILGLTYFLLTIFVTTKIYIKKERNLTLFLILPISFFLMHLSYGFGLVFGFLIYRLGKWK